MVEKLDVVMQELVKRANEDSRRLRVLEQRMDMNESKLSNLETTTNKRNDDVKKKLVELQKDIVSIKDHIEKLDSIIEKIEDKLSKTARKTDIKEFEKMIELFDPITNNYVPRKEFEELKDKVEELSGGD